MPPCTCAGAWPRWAATPSCSRSSIRPRFGLTHAIHAFVAIVGSVVAAGSPVVGDRAGGRRHAVGLPRRGGPPPPDPAAHGQARVAERRVAGGRGQAGNADPRGRLRRTEAQRGVRARRARAARPMAGDARWRCSRSWPAACCGSSGIENQALTAVQFVPTVLLILLTPAFVDIELAEAAEDRPRAAAVATALRLGDELELEHFDVWVVLTGAEKPFALGMGGWLRPRRKQLEPGGHRRAARGRGGRRAGALHPPRRPARAPSLPPRPREAVRRDRRGRRRWRCLRGPIARGPQAHQRRRGDRARPAGDQRGLRGRAGPSAEALERAYGFCAELARRLDAEVGPAL